MDDRYFYIDPRGRRSGPFSEEELRRLAASGLLEREGSLELAGFGGVIRLAETRWLRDAFQADATDSVAVGTDRRSAEAAPTPGPATPVGPSAPPSTLPPDAVARAFAARPAAQEPRPAAPAITTPWVPPVPSDIGSARAGSTDPGTTGIERSSYVLLGILPSIIGVFGIHNVVAGYTGRGIAQLVLSLFTLGGCFSSFFGAPCVCVSIPLWLALFAWTLAEVSLVRVDARGRRFA